MTGLFNVIRPVVARIIAAVIAMACAWLFNKFGWVIDPTSQSKIVQAIIEIAGVMLGAYAATHKLLNIGINPTDAATPDLAKKSS